MNTIILKRLVLMQDQVLREENHYKKTLIKKIIMMIFQLEVKTPMFSTLSHKFRHSMTKPTLQYNIHISIRNANSQNNSIKTLKET